MHVLSIEPVGEYNFEECCPHCGTFAAVTIDNNCYEYEAVCPSCGQKMMLCTLCEWDHEDSGGGVFTCDWTLEKGCSKKGWPKHDF